MSNLFEYYIVGFIITSQHCEMKLIRTGGNTALLFAFGYYMFTFDNYRGALYTEIIVAVLKVE